MVHEDAAADLCGGVDVDREHLRDSPLKKQGQRFAPGAPVIVRDPVGLNGVKPLEKQQWVGIVPAGGVPVADGLDVRACRRANAGVMHQRLVNEVAKRHGVDGGAFELGGKDKTQRILERLMV